MKKGIYLNDSIHGLIPLSEYEKRIISSIGFNRLHDVYQNSTVYLTFPTNRTKRFEHSIGTMKLCSDMFFASVLNATAENLENFYEIFRKEYRAIIEELSREHVFCEQKLGGVTPDEMPRIEFDKFRHSLIPHNVSDEYKVLHLILIQSVRVAALLHDIGHPPFSHVVENALKLVYNEYKTSYDVEKEKSDRLADFLDTMSQYFDGDKKLHEQMGDEISDSILRGVISNIENDDDNGKYDENLFETLVLKSVKRIFGETPPFSYLHRIIDGSLDGDRLDYVTRDSLNSGLDSGKIDYNRIINEMQLIVDCNEIFFCVPLKAVNSVEDFIKRRYNIYKDIIYHHRVIKTDYLLKYSVKDLVNRYLDESAIESHSKILIPYDISGLWFPLGEATTSQKSNALSQWNDSWLMTILKQIYYTEYYRNKEIKPGADEYVLKQRLSELLCNTKCYYSMIKRSENFRLIDDNVREILAGSTEEIKGLVDQINKLSASAVSNEQSAPAVSNEQSAPAVSNEQSAPAVSNEQSAPVVSNAVSEEAVVDIKGTLDFIGEILGGSISNSKGFMLSFVSRRYKAVRIQSFENLVKGIVEEETRKTFTNTKFYDTIVVFRDISIGLDTPIYFYDYSENICTLDAVSGISNILWLDSDYLPVFYIYILIKDGETIVHEKREILLKNIGRVIGERLREKIVEELKLRIEQMEGLTCVK